MDAEQATLIVDQTLRFVESEAAKGVEDPLETQAARLEIETFESDSHEFLLNRDIETDGIRGLRLGRLLAPKMEPKTDPSAP